MQSLVPNLDKNAEFQTNTCTMRTTHKADMQVTVMYNYMCLSVNKMHSPRPQQAVSQKLLCPTAD